MKKNSIILIITLWFIFLLIIPIKPSTPVEPIENRAVEIGAAFDVKEINSDKDYSYKITRNVYLYGFNDNIFTENFDGIGHSIGKTREDRQSKDTKLTLQGMEKVYLFSENQSSLGVRPCIDILFNNPYLSDNGYFVVCNNDGKDILDLKIPGYISSLDYIYGVIKNSKSSNFFSENYSLIDIYVRLDGEGKNIVVPYIDVKDDTPYIWGCALFIKDKMKSKIDMNEARIMNLLREKVGKGVISINYSTKKYIDFDCTSKKKVKCEKKDGKYIFTINLNIKGAIVNNEIDNNVINDKEVINNFESILAKEVEKQCNDFIIKMKQDYKADWLELGKYAVAKYGRKTNTDWNAEVINNSDIIVKAKATITNLGRGDY